MSTRAEYSFVDGNAAFKLKEDRGHNAALLLKVFSAVGAARLRRQLAPTTTYIVSLVLLWAVCADNSLLRPLTLFLLYCSGQIAQTTRSYDHLHCFSCIVLGRLRRQLARTTTYIVSLVLFCAVCADNSLIRPLTLFLLYCSGQFAQTTRSYDHLHCFSCIVLGSLRRQLAPTTTYIVSLVLFWAVCADNSLLRPLTLFLLYCSGQFAQTTRSYDHLHCFSCIVLGSLRQCSWFCTGLQTYADLLKVVTGLGEAGSGSNVIS